MHIRGSPSKDEFHFTASVEDDDEEAGGQQQLHKESPAAYDLPLHKFQLNFVTLQVRAIRNSPAKMVNLRETLITDTYLLYQVEYQCKYCTFSLSLHRR